MGIVLALTTAVLLASVNLIFKHMSGKGKNPYVVPFLFQCFAGLFFVPLFLLGQIKFSLELSVLLLLAGSILCYSVYNVALFKTYQHLDVSIASVILQLSLIISFTGSIIVFHENITPAKILGVVFILSANLILLLKRPTGGLKVSKKGVFWGLITALVLGTAVVLDAKNSINFSLFFYAFLTYFLPGTVEYIYGRPSIQEIKTDVKKLFGWILLAAFLGGSGYYALLNAFQLADKSVVSPILSLNSVFAALLGIIILREKADLKRKILAALLAFIGAVLLSI